MVSWSGDGVLAGYSGASGKLIPNAFLFASPGAVDVNASTRLGYALPAGTNATTYPNMITASATFTFTAADFSANPGKKLCAGMFAVPVSAFPVGKIPTVSEILAMGSNLDVWRADYYVTAPQTRTFNFKAGRTDTKGFAPNTKYWVLIYPTAPTTVTAEANYYRDLPMKGISNPNTFGRALSMWTNRQPSAPVITSPVTGAVVANGAVVPFAYTTGDPDKTTPVDATKRNLDIAGVQIQYARVPVPGGPPVEWLDLPVKTWSIYIQAGWHIRGSQYSNRAYNLQTMIDNLGIPITCGVPERLVPESNGILPGGNWQLRCRVFDYGHPYPNNFDALGLAVAGGDNGLYTPSNYPALNTSPWSAAVTLFVPSQVPPPIPLSPIMGLARPVGQATRLTWKYRNTFSPPYAQRRRWVQVREMGSAAWKTVFAGLGADPYVDLLPSNVAPAPVADTEYQPDYGFESGSVGGWVARYTEFEPLPPQGTPQAINTLDATKARSGSRYLLLSHPGLGLPSLEREFTEINPEHDTFRLRASVNPVVAASLKMQFSCVWKDSAGVSMFSTQVYKILDLPATGWTWNDFDFSFVRPIGGVTLHVETYGYGGGDSSYGGLRLDNVSLVGSSSTNTDSLDVLTAKNYEWRVRVEDMSLVQSDYSIPASFWVVPGTGSGEVRPIPSSTIDGATLGCGRHRAFIYRRGGKTRVGEIRNVSHLDWGRVRDDISTSKIVVSGWDIDCGNMLAELQTWAYEVVIFRDNGYTVDRVWEGPITLLTYERDSVTIQAKDVMGYSYRRIIKQRMSDSGTGNGRTVVARATEVLQNTFAPDDPNVLAYLTPLVRADDAMQYRSTPAYSRTAFEEVDDMAANSGLDYTAIGRAILLWGTKHRIGTLPEFRDEDLGSPPIVSEYGMSMANRYVVSDGNGVWGEATRLDVSGNDPVYGLVEMLSSSWASDSPEDTGTYTQAGLETIIESFEGFAERSISDRFPPPVVVRVPDNTTLNPGAVISIQQLVPGVVIPLRSTGTLRSVVATQKLDSINVTEENGIETISITLSPFSRDDASVGEGEATV